MQYAGDTLREHHEDGMLRPWLSLVQVVVRQLASQASIVIDRHDMLQIGMTALLECLRRYGEPDENFSGFAMLRIRGAILDELRRLDWRPRHLRQDAHRLRDETRRLTMQLRRPPQEQELMTALEVSRPTLQALQQAENAEAMASFDQMLSEGFDPGGQEGPDRILMLRDALAKALLQLNERERQVIQLYYESELSLKEIALVLEVSEARVCQINKAALGKMRSFVLDAV